MRILRDEFSKMAMLETKGAPLVMSCSKVFRECRIPRYAPDGPDFASKLVRELKSEGIWSRLGFGGVVDQRKRVNGETKKPGPGRCLGRVRGESQTEE